MGKPAHGKKDKKVPQGLVNQGFAGPVAQGIRGKSPKPFLPRYDTRSSRDSGLCGRRG